MPGETENLRRNKVQRTVGAEVHPLANDLLFAKEHVGSGELFVQSRFPAPSLSKGSFGVLLRRRTPAKAVHGHEVGRPLGGIPAADRIPQSLLEALQGTLNGVFGEHEHPDGKESGLGIFMNQACHVDLKTFVPRSPDIPALVDDLAGNWFRWGTVPPIDEKVRKGNRFHRVDDDQGLLASPLGWRGLRGGRGFELLGLTTVGSPVEVDPPGCLNPVANVGVRVDSPGRVFLPVEVVGVQRPFLVTSFGAREAGRTGGKLEGPTVRQGQLHLSALPRFEAFGLILVRQGRRVTGEHLEGAHLPGEVGLLKKLPPDPLPPVRLLLGVLLHHQGSASLLPGL